MKHNVYLAGGMRTEWRMVIKELYKDVDSINFLDPTEHGLSDEVLYTMADIDMIKSSHLMFAYFEATNPAGHNTAFEIGLAHALGIPIILVNENGIIDRYIGMPRSVAIAYTQSFRDGVAKLIRIMEALWT